MRALALCAALVVPVPAMAASLSATVPSGVMTRVSEHTAFGQSCTVQRVVLNVTMPPANGDATWQYEDRVMPAKTTLGGEQPCAGTTAPTAVIYYQSKPGFKGKDQFKYQRTNEDNPNDRLNGEIVFTVTVQ